jgi:hypothetical protein
MNYRIFGFRFMALEVWEQCVNTSEHKREEEYTEKTTTKASLIWTSLTAIKNKQNSVALSPQANYIHWATTTCWRNLVPTFVDRGVSCGQSFISVF